METICYDIWHDEDAGDFYGEIYSFNRKTRKVTEIESPTRSMSTVDAMKAFILGKYPNAICIHCG